jgi:hypothetical protein
MGQRTCGSNGVWGECVGDQVVTFNSWQLEGLHLLNQPTGVDAGNTCDPSLLQINSILAPDAAVDAGEVTTTDAGGVQLALVSIVQAGGCTSLTITPATSPSKDIQITQMGGSLSDGGYAVPSPNTVQFTATVNPPGCFNGTPKYLWTMDQPSIGTISSSGLLSLAYPYAGPIHVTAYLGSLSAVVTSNVTVNVLDTSSLPPDAGNAAQGFNTTCGVADAGGG